MWLAHWSVTADGLMAPIPRWLRNKLASLVFVYSVKHKKLQRNDNFITWQLHKKMKNRLYICGINRQWTKLIWYTMEKSEYTTEQERQLTRLSVHQVTVRRLSWSAAEFINYTKHYTLLSPLLNVIRFNLMHIQNNFVDEDCLIRATEHC